MNERIDNEEDTEVFGPCPFCGRPSFELYDDDDEGSYYCGSLKCGYLMQQAIDYIADRGSS